MRTQGGQKNGIILRTSFMDGSLYITFLFGQLRSTRKLQKTLSFHSEKKPPLILIHEKLQNFRVKNNHV